MIASVASVDFSSDDSNHRSRMVRAGPGVAGGDPHILRAVGWNPFGWSRRRAAVERPPASSLHPYALLEEAPLMALVLDHLLEVTERGRAPFGRRQQLRDRAVRVECQRLAFKYLLPQFERPTRFGTVLPSPRAIRGRSRAAYMRSVMSKNSPASSRSAAEPGGLW